MLIKVHACKYAAVLVIAFHIYHLTYLTFYKIFYTVCSEIKVDIIYVSTEPYGKEREPYDKKSNLAEQIIF